VGSRNKTPERSVGSLSTRSW